MTVSANLTLGTLQLSNTNGNANGYFANAKLYMSTSGTRASATIVSGASVAINGTDMTVTGFSTPMVTGTTYTYYLDADVSVSFGSLPSTIRFGVAFVKGPGYFPDYTQSGTALGTTYTLAKPTITIGNLTSGITASPITFGQTGIAVFGFSVTVTGSLTVNQYNLPFSGNVGNTLSNAKLYRSTTSSTYPTGFLQVGTGTIDLNTNPLPIPLSSAESFPGPTTTVNYFLVADYTGTCPTSTSFNFGVSSTSSPSFVIGPSSVNYPSANTVAGNTFAVGYKINWVGGNSSNWSDLGNFSVLCGGAPTSIGANDVVQVGVNTFTNQPTINSATNASIGQLIIGSAKAVTMTVNSGQKLTINNDLTINASTTAVFTGTGGVDIGPAADISFTSTSTSVLSINSGLTFTLKSDATSTASVGKIGSSSIVGTGAGAIVAERYIPAGNRGYRVLSSPVYNITGSAPYAGLKSYDLNSIKLNTLISGPSDATNGFVVSLTHNPSAFAYNETLTAPLTNNISTSDYKGFASTSEYIPIGNGILLFYRGNENTTKSGGSGNPFQGPNYPTPEFTTLKNVGTIATGTITVNRPVFPASSTFYNVLNTAAGSPGPRITGSSATLSYTVTSLPGTDGFNMLGNPYPSTIDLEALVYNTDFAGLSGNSTATFYTLNPNNPNGFGTYTRTGTGATGTALNGGTRYVLSGEGFFVKAASTSAYFKFTEASKTTYPTTGNIPSVFSLKDKNPAVKIKLIQDSTFYNETLVTFSKDNKSTFTEDEDVAYLSAPNQQVFMYSTSDEGTSCIINRLPALETIKIVKLYAEGAVSGLYTIEFSNANTIDSRYRIYLKDAFKKDSLDVTNNTTYSFNIDRTNAATYGANRFTLAVYKDNNAAYKLMSFTGSKQQGASVLTWTVQNESDVYTFDLERSIDGGKTYILAGTVQSASKGTYSVTDTKPVYGDNLYRLKQSDVNDAITYSDIVTLTYDMPQVAETTINVYPNPTSDKIKVDFTQTILNPLEVHVVNSNGKIVIKSTFNAAQHIEQDVSGLMTGIYIIDVIDTASNKKISSSKFIKN
jgi:hypothetical protein